MTDQRHRYDYPVQPNSSPARVIRMVGHGQRVLELGSGPGSITRHLKNNGCSVTALELDPEAIVQVAEFCERVIPCDLNAAGWSALLTGTAPFPVIVAADVFEHLYDPAAVLRQSLPLLSPDGSLIVSLPHIGHNSVIACLLNGDFAYQPWGLLDSTHIRFWCLKNMQQLFTDAGYKIVEAEFVVRAPEQTEFAYQWHKLPPETRAVLTRNRSGNIYQVVIRAVPAEASGIAVQLTSLPVPRPEALPVGDRSALRNLFRRLGARLDPAIQARIVRVLRRLNLWPKSSR
ncbi:MAG: class I SAM-dependent methyltransferase [Sulfuricellaceae bacterium]|jgi:2-polyprenyl-3-methyl-5-hydroxy-6-metoxy-1,4-benzoquinol methylase